MSFELLQCVMELKSENKPIKWNLCIIEVMYKEDFTVVVVTTHYMDSQSKEDSDIFNRFVLNEYELIQTWKGFVYHMIQRGSRFVRGGRNMMVKSLHEE